MRFPKKQKSFVKGLLAVLFSAAVLGLAGCSDFMTKSTQMTVHNGARVFAGPTMELILEASLNVKSSRLVKEGMAGNLLAALAIADMHPNNLKIQSKTAFFLASYGLLVEDDDPEYACKLYEMAQHHGVLAMCTDSAFRRGFESGLKPADLVRHLDHRYVEAMAWTANAQVFYLLLNMNDKIAQLEVPHSVAMIRRVIELDPDYMHGSCKVFLASYYSIIPEFLGVGGGPKNAEAMFEEARKASDGKFLIVDLYEARFLAATLGDRVQFRKLLNKVLSSDPDILEGATLLNSFAQAKARLYLEHEEEFF